MNTVSLGCHGEVGRNGHFFVAGFYAKNHKKEHKVLVQSIHFMGDVYIYTYMYTLLEFNVAVENGPFLDNS